MTDKQDLKTQSTDELHESVAQGYTIAKRELARRLLKGKGIDKDEAKAVSILEDCVALGDSEAMVMLAKCCAFGHGMEHNGERAEALVSEAAEKGNKEAQTLMKLIDDWKGQESIDLSYPALIIISPNDATQFTIQEPENNTERSVREYPIKQLAFCMAILPCQSVHLSGECFSQFQRFI